MGINSFAGTTEFFRPVNGRGYFAEAHGSDPESTGEPEGFG